MKKDLKNPMSLPIGLKVKKFMDILIVPVPIIFLRKGLKCSSFLLTKQKREGKEGFNPKLLINSTAGTIREFTYFY